MMQITELIGYLAASLTTASFVPQAWHTFKTRDVRGISLGMYSLFTAGIALWLAYGLLISAWPIVVANVITLALTAAIQVVDNLLDTHAHSAPTTQPKAVLCQVSQTPRA